MEEDYENNIGFLIHDVARLMRNLFDKRMSSLGLTRSQWWILNYLYFNEGINQSEFANLLDLEKGPLSRLLERMEIKGWVIRENDINDKRIKNIYLSKKIKPLITRQEALSDLNEKEVKKLRYFLKMIKTTLNKVSI